MIWTNHKYPGVGGPPYNEFNDGYAANTSVWNFTPQFGVGMHYFITSTSIHRLWSQRHPHLLGLAWRQKPRCQREHTILRRLHLVEVITAEPLGSRFQIMNSEAIIECVPNFSEGTDLSKVSRIVLAMQVPGVSLLDWSLDLAHNRSVVTIAGPAEAVVESAIRGAGKAAEIIDLTRQNGVHPRIGAADVIPFIPVRGASLAECAMLARQAGLSLWRRHGVPVYFYGASAARLIASIWKMFAAVSSKAFAMRFGGKPLAGPT